MATFDFEKAAAIITSSSDPVFDALGLLFGVPNCMLQFTKGVLSSFPSSILNGINAGIADGIALADSVFKDIMRQIFLDTGIVEYDTTLGRFVFVSSSSNLGVESDALQSLNNLYGLGQILGIGAQAWVIGQNIGDQMEDIKNCIDQFKSYESLQKGPAAVADKFFGFTMQDSEGNDIEFLPPLPPTVAASQIYDQNKGVLEQAAVFIAQGKSQQQIIQELLQCRQATPDDCPEPVFSNNLIVSIDFEGQTLGEYLNGKTTFNLVDTTFDNEGNPEPPPDPGEIFDPYTDVIYPLSGMQPPLAKKGQFLFSRTGVYYDSYGGGLEWEGCISNIVNAIYYDDNGNPIPGTGVPANMVKWLHEYNPNIGGKGEVVTWNTFNQYTNTIFAMDHIDDSPTMQTYYDEDHFLQVLIDQRTREIYDLSSYIGDLVASGYSEDSSLLFNQRQVLLSQIADHDSKIRRRKKQIQIHVGLAPSAGMYQSTLHEGIPIPINDFEGLNGSLLAVEISKQQKLMFNPGEVSGVVLPLCPTFIKSEIPQNTFTVEELTVPPVGVGSIITNDPPFTGTSGTVLSLTDNITTDKLVAVYNFLDGDIVVPDSANYWQINCATEGASDTPAQLAASSYISVFPSGVGIPYFRGICNFFSGIDGNPKASTPIADGVYDPTTDLEYLYSPYRPYGYARLQADAGVMDDFLWASGGATFEFWCHVPDLGDSNGEGWAADQSLSSLHRVVLGCENRGGTFTASDSYWVAGPQQDDVVRGLLMGFTRDRRITKGYIPSNNPADNDIDDGLVFHMSPTQSIDTSGVTFLSTSADVKYCEHDSVPASGYYGLAVDVSVSTASGNKLSDCSSTFVLATVTIDYGADLVSIYLNGELLIQQSVVATFGFNSPPPGEPPIPPQIPSMIDSQFSFQYYPLQWTDDDFPTTVNPDNLFGSDFWRWGGPRPQGGNTHAQPLTPWIIGGGYTDGMSCHEVGDETEDMPWYEGRTSNNGMNFMGGVWGGKKSGLHGFLGSIKLYNKALSPTDALRNYKAQQGFFENIRTYSY